MTTSERNSKAGSNYLVFTTFVCGGIIMVVEVLGSRLIGPSFGASLFVWTSLIAVTLTSLALGYWVGGRLADNKNSPDFLFIIILVAGLSLLLVPIIKGPVIGGALSLGLRGGTLASSTVLFFPPLFILGMVAPYIVKLHLEDNATVGKTVGSLYAISTAGSVIGTISTGFLLIPYLGLDKIIYLSSLILISLSAFYWIFFKRQFYILVLPIIPVIFIIMPQKTINITREDGTRVSVIAHEESPYGEIKVVDYAYGDTHYREFLIENIIQGGIDVNSGLSIFKYQYHLEQLGHAYVNDARRALVIGLGAGIVPSRFEQYYNIETDVAEIDKSVVRIAKEYFNFDPSEISVHIQDGRNYLRSTTTNYDIVILDAFAGDSPPSHIISLESFALIKEKLTDKGVLIVNFLGSNEKVDSVALSSLEMTLEEVFDNVDIYVPEEYYHNAPRIINFAFAAYGGPKKRVTGIKINPPIHAPFKRDLDTYLERKITVSGNARLLRDNYNPIDFYDMKMRERLRAETIASTDKKIVLY